MRMSQMVTWKQCDNENWKLSETQKLLGNCLIEFLIFFISLKTTRQHFFLIQSNFICVAPNPSMHYLRALYIFKNITQKPNSSHNKQHFGDCGEENTPYRSRTRLGVAVSLDRSGWAGNRSYCRTVEMLETWYSSWKLQIIRRGGTLSVLHVETRGRPRTVVPVSTQPDIFQSILYHPVSGKPIRSSVAPVDVWAVDTHKVCGDSGMSGSGSSCWGGRVLDTCPLEDVQPPPPWKALWFLRS